MKLRPKITLIDHLKKLTDPRVERTKDHKLIDILTIAVCAMICGADNWVAMETYGNSKYKWLKQFLELKNGIPSHDTFGRVFARIDPTEFEQCFLEWVKTITQLLPGNIVSLDGKTARHSTNSQTDKKAIHLVNAWASEQKLVLAQQKVDEHTNEITTIPQLIKLLELKGCLVTLDAIGTQTEIAELIRSKEADYCLALKGNQKHLHTEVQQLFSLGENQQWQGIEHSFHQTIEKRTPRAEVSSAYRTEQEESWAHRNPSLLDFK